MTIAHVGGDPTTFTADDSPGWTVGQKYSYKDGTYRYVLNAGADAFVAGDAVGMFKTTPVHGHADATAATVVSASCYGVALYAVANGEYGFVQTDGPNVSVITTDGSIAQGSVLTVATTTCTMKALSGTSAATDYTLGMASTADTSTTLAVGDAILAIP